MSNNHDERLRRAERLEAEARALREAAAAAGEVFKAAGSAKDLFAGSSSKDEHRPLEGQPGTAKYERDWGRLGCIFGGGSLAVLLACGVLASIGSKGLQSIKLPSFSFGTDKYTYDEFAQHMGDLYRQGIALAAAEPLVLLQRDDIRDTVTMYQRAGLNAQVYPHDVAGYIVRASEENHPTSSIPALLEVWQPSGNDLSGQFRQDHRLAIAADKLLIGAGIVVSIDGTSERDTGSIGMDGVSTFWLRVGAEPTIGNAAHQLDLAQGGGEYLDAQPKESRRRLFAIGFVAMLHGADHLGRAPQQALDTVEHVADTVAALRLEDPRVLPETP